jgi:hypothetical protein
MDIVFGRDGVHFLNSAFLCEDFAVLPVMLRRKLLGCSLLDGHLFFLRYDVTTDKTNETQIVKKQSSTSAAYLSDGSI